MGEFLWIFFWLGGGRGWLPKSMESSLIWTFKGLFSRVLYAIVRYKLVEGLLEGKGKFWDLRPQMQTCREAWAMGLRLSCTCCVVLSRCPNLSGPQLVDL